jgi:hypothetical protein
LAQNATVSRTVVLRGLNVTPSIEATASAMDGVQVPDLFPVDRAALQTGLSTLLGRPIGRELRSRPSTWWKLCVVEVALDHAATVEICVGTASITGGGISAIASVCI